MLYSKERANMEIGIADATPREEAAKPSRPIPWSGMVWFFVLLVICYAPVLARLVKQWNEDEDMGHGFFVPVLALYIAWQMRDRVLSLRPQPSWWGLVLVAWGALQLMVATLGAELFLARTAFIISVLGLILYTGGWPYLKALRFPLALLVFMVPIPAIIYNQITFPLQLLASRLAAAALAALDIPVLREGNILELASQKLSVVEACSGIRSLLSLSFLSLIYGYFFEPKTWMRWVLLLLTVPIAIMANAGRVTGTGILSERDPELAQGFFHTAQGWVIFMVALVLLIGSHQLLNWVYKRLRHAR
jgi:exosortase